MITKFFNMSSGGSEKEEWTLISVNLPQEEAVEWFEKTFDHDPYNVTCGCCGPDYSIGEYESIEKLLQDYKSYASSHKHFEV